MSRWKAALIHLCISASIAAAVSALLLLVWYPPPYFLAGGADGLLALVVGIDLTVGPLITSIIYKHGKPGLKVDLAVIGIVQAIALAYGVSVIVKTRPVFLVAAIDRFVLVDANQITPKDLRQASRPEWQHLSWAGPILVGVELPTDVTEHNALLFGALTTGKDVQDFPKYYVPYTKAAPALLKRAHTIASLIQMYPDQRDRMGRWLKRHGTNEAKARWLPVQARVGDLVMIVDAATGAPLGALPINPWPIDTIPPEVTAGGDGSTSKAGKPPSARK